MSISSTEDRNKVLDKVSQLLSERIADIVSANQIDYESGKTSGLNDQMLDRLLLTPERIEGMAVSYTHLRAHEPRHDHV